MKNIFKENARLILIRINTAQKLIARKKLHVNKEIK